MGKIHSYETILFAHTKFAYAESADGRINYVRLGDKQKTHAANDATRGYISAVKGIASSETRIIGGLSLAIALAIASMVFSGISVFVMELVFSAFKIPYSAADAVLAVVDLFSSLNKVDKYFDQI
ncbi:hypothetical protein RT41_GL000946 [Lactococcus fujiensis JCM 16395]|uniref:Uncharacterized protein n=1 Tax=Lactococcus fujiensis JCM 16395 TaxID=1291764 RepID=A0A2A5RHX4_9LACT|nr:hypothetical protein RT41_GL000946 [Lactococcus fujiensis JCM 16395]